MNADQKYWNGQQQRLRRALLEADNHPEAMGCFLSQHAMVHSAKIAQPELGQAEFWSFEDKVWQDMSEEQLRGIPPGFNHSIAWVTWHISRIEDVTMNLLLGGVPQILNEDGWLERMKITERSTGNLIEAAGVAELSTAIDLEALRAYRVAVGRRTQELAQQMRPQQLKQKVDPSRLEQVRAEGAVVEGAADLLDYWGGLTIAGLLLMPPTRHNFVHLNEGLRIKQKL